tara:strand:- start:139 stop:636 length:498 start_codon:yes stop_codon:yes gene_type:complete
MINKGIIYFLIAVFSLAIIATVIKRQFAQNEEEVEVVKEKFYKIITDNGQVTATFSDYFDRANHKSFSDTRQYANQVFTYNAFRIKKILDEEPSVSQIILTITSNCSGKGEHDDIIVFNTFEVNKFKGAEDYLFDIVRSGYYIPKINNNWYPCTDINPAPIVNSF